MSIDGSSHVSSVGQHTSLDDVVITSAGLEVSDLDGHAVEAVRLATGATTPVVTGAAEPQGLALAPGGRLLVADSGAKRIAVVPGC